MSVLGRGRVDTCKYKTDINPSGTDTVYSCGCFAFVIMDKAGWIQCSMHAAAPELLEACKRARLILGMITTNSKAYAPDTMKMLDEAIAKAEGI